MGTYSYSSNTSADIIKETVGTAGTYDITGYGGQGGTGAGRAGGSGAEVSGNFMLSANETLEIFVGGAGNSGEFGGGGGGGSFVLGKPVGATSYTLLLAAGGGGGAGKYSGKGGAAPVTLSTSGGAGGTSGQNGGGGGAGSTGNGANGIGQNGADYGYGTGGTSVTSAAPGVGGIYVAGRNQAYAGAGGFGGGGAGASSYGGGGGGFTGGNAAFYTGVGSAAATGGTSFLANTATMRTIASAATENAANAGAGKVTITQSVCYVTGTLIRTARGDVAVETLAIGDLVVTASGVHRPIKWIGHRDTDCARHPEPRKVWPVRVRSGALGAGLPYADLWLSPGHALCLDEVLIPVRCLVQGDAIRQVERDRVTYWHVELDTHDILVADGVPAESYLDTGNRGGFDNAPGVVDLHPDFEPRDTSRFCRPYVESGPLLSAARRKLHGGAEPAPSQALVHMVADGMVLHGMVGKDQAVFVVPGGTRDLRLVSPVFRADHPDIRTLGVVVGSLTIEAANHARRTVALGDPGLFAGFHAIESDGPTAWRWTNGAAHFAADLWDGLDGAFLVRIGGLFAVERGVDRAQDRRAA